MIYANGHSGDICEIGDDYIVLDKTLIRGITNMAEIQLTDDSDGAEIEAAVLAGLRKRRDALLAECDWTQIQDVPMEDAQRQAWAAYRQALRDLPETATLSPGGIVWPDKP